MTVIDCYGKSGYFGVQKNLHLEHEGSLWCSQNIGRHLCMDVCGICNVPRFFVEFISTIPNPEAGGLSFDSCP